MRVCGEPVPFARAPAALSDAVPGHVAAPAGPRAQLPVGSAPILRCHSAPFRCVHIMKLNVRVFLFLFSCFCTLPPVQATFVCLVILFALIIFIKNGQTFLAPRYLTHRYRAIQKNV